MAIKMANNRGAFVHCCRLFCMIICSYKTMLWSINHLYHYGRIYAPPFLSGFVKLKFLCPFCPDQLAEDNANNHSSSYTALSALLLNKAALPIQLSQHCFWTKLIASMTWVEGLFYITIIWQTTSIVASKLILTQLTKPVNARKNCSCRVKTRGLYVKTGTRHGYIPTQKVQASVLSFPPKAL